MNSCVSFDNITLQLRRSRVYSVSQIPPGVTAIHFLLVCKDQKKKTRCTSKEIHEPGEMLNR